MKSFLFLDDMDERHLEFMRICDTARNADRASTSIQAIDHLKSHDYGVVFLDHDLAEDHYNQEGQTNPVNIGTGAEVAQFIAQMDNPPKIVVIHSWNPAGTQNMFNILFGKVETLYREKFGIKGGPFGRLVDKLSEEN